MAERGRVGEAFMQLLSHSLVCVCVCVLAWLTFESSQCYIGHFLRLVT